MEETGGVRRSVYTSCSVRISTGSSELTVMMEYRSLGHKGTAMAPRAYRAVDSTRVVLEMPAWKRRQNIITAGAGSIGQIFRRSHLFRSSWAAIRGGVLRRDEYHTEADTNGTASRRSSGSPVK